MNLNCDLGESFGAWTMGMDEVVIPLIDQANIACGFHASDPLILYRTVSMVVHQGVEIGAHPSYPDLVGFGRRSMALSEEELKTLIWYQIGALDGMASMLGSRVTYVKPHGAMNNDMMRSDTQLRAVMGAVADFRNDLKLMIPVTLNWQSHQAMAGEFGLELIMEAFADRAYDDRGQLVARSAAGSVFHDEAEIVAQAQTFSDRGGAYSVTGQWLDLPAQSLCVHGDNPESVQAVKAIRAALVKAE